MSRSERPPDSLKRSFRIANPTLAKDFCHRYPEMRERFIEALAELCADPVSRPPAVSHLKGQYHCSRRKRFGSFRIRYDFDPGNQLIRLLEVGPRSNVY